MGRAETDHLSSQALKHWMKTRWMGKMLYFHDVLDSTNLEAKSLGENGAPEGTLVVADRQKQGRGRLGRTWSSPAGCGLWMSAVLRPTFSPYQASMVTLVAAMAVREAIENVTGLPVQIKWPNDLVIEGKKVCGILTEMCMEGEVIRYIVPGIGINVNNQIFPEELCGKATSLAIAAGKSFCRAQLAGAVCQSFEHYYADFLVHGNLTGIKECYNAHLVNCNREVRIVGKADSFCAEAEGIDETGALWVRRANGMREAICSGEVSVRGIAGYI